MDKKQIEEEAKKRFPIGCKVSNVNLMCGCKFEVKGSNYYWSGSKQLCIDRDSVKNEDSAYTVYDGENWAEIIKYPKGYVQQNSTYWW